MLTPEEIDALPTPTLFVEADSWGCWWYKIKLGHYGFAERYTEWIIKERCKAEVTATPEQSAALNRLLARSLRAAADQLDPPTTDTQQ